MKYRIIVTFVVFDKKNFKEFESDGKPFLYWLKRTVTSFARNKWHTGYVTEIQVQKGEGSMKIYRYKLKSLKRNTVQSIRIKPILKY